MSEHKYILEPYKGMNSRYRCPCCKQRDKTFSLYIVTETGEHIHPNVGRCNRESKCGNHYTPKQYFKDNNISFDKTGFQHLAKSDKNRKQIKMIEKPVSFIPVEVFKASLTAHETNHFVKFLIDLFGIDITSEVVSRYFIACSKHWTGATVFWQIDIQGKIRTGKIMLYSPTTGKRIKEPFNHIQWVHKVLKKHEFGLKQCLFGEHLLFDKTKPVAIVESEKTAIIASIYLPEFIWVAVGSLTNLTAEKCKVLKGRKVTLFPDLNGFDKWNTKAKELSQIAIFTVSDLLERKATETEREQVFDLADYLLRFRYKEFLHHDLLIPKPPEQPTILQTLPKTKKIEQLQPVISFNKTTHRQTENWQQVIDDLESYFASVKIPTHPVKLNGFSSINNCSLFIENHFATIKSNNGNRTFLPYLNRLQELQYLLNSKI